MPRNFSLRTTGLRELDAALGKLPKAVGKRVTRDALIEAGEVTAQAARALAPVDKGYLRESITVGSKLSRSQRKALETRSSVEVYVGPGPHPQGIMQEFGTFKEPAQPFMRPAWDATGEQVLGRTGVILSDAVMKAAARHARKEAKRRQRKG
ncbi:HK97-gp10 family putative phage morphogenesis protein [Sphingomonas montanisoli]|uniref:HK97 gp10 family phage protein n=1 Tax=Sphingomonas montanisoli TaxID=2606412 RepID=A0A5D9BWL9_9SPHN|nr:HK97-gp10 family putative phage morphogenesis protein [Sphingomonas montanisoli]TZG23889.1 HK97 gp10 family phage protein [Sphingomonas montanisoli]